jgi:hypothetical protein
MNAGDTFIIPVPGTSYDSHLWMLISDPQAGEFGVIVNFTSWRADKDQACIVEPGDHPLHFQKNVRQFQRREEMQADRSGEFDFLQKSEKFSSIIGFIACENTKRRSRVTNELGMRAIATRAGLDFHLIEFRSSRPAQFSTIL